MYNGEIAACRLARRSADWQQIHTRWEDTVHSRNSPPARVPLPSGVGRAFYHFGFETPHLHFLWLTRSNFIELRFFISLLFALGSTFTEPLLCLFFADLLKCSVFQYEKSIVIRRDHHDTVGNWALGWRRGGSVTHSRQWSFALRQVLAADTSVHLQVCRS